MCEHMLFVLQAVLSGGPTIRHLPRADLLPVALYVLFSQLAAAKDALDLPIALTISGQAEEADSLAQAAVSEVQDPSATDPATKRRKLPPSVDLYKVPSIRLSVIGYMSYIDIPHHSFRCIPSPSTWKCSRRNHHRPPNP